MLYICVCVEIKRRGRGGKQIPAAEVYRGEEEREGRERPSITSPAACPCHQAPKSLESKARATAETEGAAWKRPKRSDGVGDAVC